MRRCTKCILPETMPFITFDDEGVCNYCHNHTSCFNHKSKEDLFKLAGEYRNGGVDCLVPLSGGRDSCYVLWYAVEVLNLNPIAVFYDWGFVSTTAKENVSNICKALDVPLISITSEKERNINLVKRNYKALQHKMDISILSVLTAQDKRIHKHIRKIKSLYDIRLVIWGNNKFERTFFKAGLLGIKPNFGGKQIYRSGLISQIIFHTKKIKRAFRNKKLLNFSIVDAFVSEMYRSVVKKKDEINLFDYIRWDEHTIVNTIKKGVGWKSSSNNTWRDGDLVSAYTSMVYLAHLGFTENDTFRSNQIRDGVITRDEALKFIEKENVLNRKNMKEFLKTLHL